MVFILTSFMVFLLGLIVGSFLNVVAIRFNTGRTVMGRSHCFSCARVLSWCELVPVASFIMQRGRCRSCHALLSLQYPLVELASGVLFVLAWVAAPTPLAAVFYVTFFCLLLLIFIYDMRHTIIPDTFVWGVIGLSFLGLFVKWQPLMLSSPSFSQISAGVGGFLFFFVLWWVSRGRWMGLGDAKLALGLGWFLGPSTGFAALILSFWIGALAGILLLVISKKGWWGTIRLEDTLLPRTIKSEIPFAPFLIVSALITLLVDLPRLFFFWP